MKYQSKRRFNAMPSMKDLRTRPSGMVKDLEKIYTGGFFFYGMDKNGKTQFNYVFKPETESKVEKLVEVICPTEGCSTEALSDVSL